MDTRARVTERARACIPAHDACAPGRARVIARGGELAAASRARRNVTRAIERSIQRGGIVRVRYVRVPFLHQTRIGARDCISARDRARPKYGAARARRRADLACESPGPGPASRLAPRRRRPARATLVCTCVRGEYRARARAHVRACARAVYDPRARVNGRRRARTFH